MVLPNFLYVGMSKAASTYIHQVCAEHPEVYVPFLKDIFFFDKHWSKGLAWYEEHFEEANSAKAIGEVSHDYWQDEAACQRIRDTLPDVKIIVCLREPTSWLPSKYIYETGRHGLLTHPSLMAFAGRPAVVRELHYAENMRRLYRYFSKDQLCVLFYDGLCENPQDFCRKLFGFLGVEKDFMPPSLNKKIFTAHYPRIKCFAVLSQQIVDALRARGLSGVLGRVKQNSFLHSLVFTPRGNKPALNAQESQAFIATLRPEIQALQDMLGESLPPAWRRIYGL